MTNYNMTVEEILKRHGVYSFDLEITLLRHFDVLCESYRFVIRKECADRAVECGEKAGMNKLQLASLRAAIEGKP